MRGGGAHLEDGLRNPFNVKNVNKMEMEFDEFCYNMRHSRTNRCSAGSTCAVCRPVSLRNLVRGYVERRQEKEMNVGMWQRKINNKT